jgi:phage baseplate assembly protein W
MKQHRTFKRNILDINTPVGVGVSLPLDGPAVFNSTYSTKDQIKSNLLNILLTEKGERINEPTFGVGLRKLLFSQNIEKEALLDNINDQLSSFLPEITIQDLKIKDNQKENTVNINVIYVIDLTNITQNLQVNFNY